MVESKKDIKILFFSSKNDRQIKAILKSIPDFFPENKVFQYSDLDNFSIALRDMLLGSGIVLIVIRDQWELDNMLHLGSRINDHENILVLDELAEEQTQKALQLYPRYTSYIKDEYSDITLVLEKMIHRIQRTQ